MTQSPRLIRDRSRPFWLSLTAASVVLLVLAGRRDLVGANPLFHAHGYCYLWQADLVAGHVVADTLIALSYVAISAALWYLVRRARGQIPFSWLLVAFGIFIVACGGTHFMEVVTLWRPWFWMSLDVKVITAVASVVTAITLPVVTPRILYIVDSAALSEERRTALERARDELERRVTERTRELADALAREHALRNEAQAASRSKDEFLMTVSHELRTPLTAIYGWARMLKSGQVRPGQEPHAIDAIERNAVTQTRLIKDLLDVAAAVSGKLHLDVRAVALPPVINAAVDSIRPAADAKSIRLNSAFDPQAGPVSGDPDRLQQIVWNLLLNAIKFTPAGGQVDIRLERANAGVAVVVSDNGQGIAPELLPYVFDRFRQGHGGTPAARGGLGLGLAIVRHLVELHSGSVTVQSDGKGRGATFRVLLPSAVIPRDAAPSDAAEAAAERGLISTPIQDVKVLVVDDDRPTQEMFAAALEGAGAEVRIASSGHEALSMLDRWIPDVLVSDIQMPNQDGYTLVRQARALTMARGCRLPAIAVTAYARAEERARALNDGFEWHLSKPVEPSELISAVAALAGRSA